MRERGGVIRRIRLGDIVKVVTPPTKLAKKQYLLTGNYPIIDQGKESIIGYTNDETALVDEGKLVLFGDHTCEIKYFDKPFAQGADGLKILKPLGFVNARYLYYFICSLHINPVGYQRHWSILVKENILVPSMQVQQRTVEILDKFSSMTTSLTDGLPAEIKLHQQQYEYYRDKLLSFNPS